MREPAGEIFDEYARFGLFGAPPRVGSQAGGENQCRHSAYHDGVGGHQIPNLGLDAHTRQCVIMQ